VLADTLGEAVPQLVRDLSPYGMFVETPLPLDMGEELVVAFTPRGIEREVLLAAHVARVTFGRRGGERGLAGMGIAFDGVEESLHDALVHALRGLPPPLPRAREIRTYIDVPVVIEEDLGDRVNELSVIEHLCLLEEPPEELDDDSLVTAFALAQALSGLMTG
jgi:hypothetical protein